VTEKLLIDKLYLLESQLRKFHGYKILEPFVFNPRDTNAIQFAAKKIASHLKLENMTFIISYATQGKNTGGHIQLDNSNDVFIEIDSDIKHDYEAVLSVLAHEICHKYLHKYNIKLFPEFENEILTDTATIFTGLGKLTLNGCEKTHMYTNVNLDGSKTKTTKTQKLGYLNKSQFAFIYKICSEIHRIDEKDLLSNLSPNSKAELQKIQQKVNLYLSHDFFKRDFYYEAFKYDLKESQSNIAIFQRNVLTIENVVLPHCIKTIEQYNKLIYNKFNLIQDKLKSLEDSTSITYITNMAISHDYSNFKKEVIEFEKNYNQLIRSIDKFNQFVQNNSSEISNSLTSETSFLNIFKCPNCKKEMKISSKKLARISCSQCNHNFIIDTGHERETTNKQTVNKIGILAWIKSIFKK
jgi:ribosomal protein S27E